MLTPKEIDIISSSTTWRLQTMIRDIERQVKTLVEDPRWVQDYNNYKVNIKAMIEDTKWMTETEFRRMMKEDGNWIPGDSRKKYIEFLIEELNSAPIDWAKVIEHYELVISFCKNELARRGEL
jgi:uncharacterized short protein YbdD (DUF466 family)